MIVSHRLKTIFVKTRKTAGTSVELALSTRCGPKDVITPVTDRDEKLRRDVGGLGPQHHRAPLRDLTRAELAHLVRSGRSPKRFYNHIPAREAVRHLGQEVWDRYLTFTIERNPWDKAVSRYFWEGRRRGLPDFATFLRSCPRHKLTCFDIYADETGSIMVDRVLAYERLDEEMATIWSELGVAPAPLPRAKGSHRPQGARDYRQLFSDDDAAFLAEVCSREISAFGYRFEDAVRRS